MNGKSSPERFNEVIVNDNRSRGKDIYTDGGCLEKEHATNFMRLSIDELGIDIQSFCNEIVPEFGKLQWDMYRVKTAQQRILISIFLEKREELNFYFPAYYSSEIDLDEYMKLADCKSQSVREILIKIPSFLKKGIAEFVLKFNEGQMLLMRVKAKPYIQPDLEGHKRSLPRHYPEAPSAIVENARMTSLITKLSLLVKERVPDCKELKILIHPTSVFCTDKQVGIPSFEGIHSDGADFIVPALILKRQNILGGESIVYSNDRKEILRTVLQPGQGIFLNDRHLLHDVTPIIKDPSSNNHIGVRHMIGFDFFV